MLKLDTCESENKVSCESENSDSDDLKNIFSLKSENNIS
jgi:hypothetical protein